MIKQDKISTSKETYIINKWRNTYSLSKIPYFGKVIGVPFAKFASIGEDGANIEEALPEALLILFMSLEEEGMVDVASKILDGVYSVKTNQQVDIDKDFDDISEILELCVLALKYQYSSLMNFLSGKGLAGLAEMGQGMNALNN